MQRHISTFTSADEIAAHLMAGNTIAMPFRRCRPFSDEDVISDIPASEIRAAIIQSADNAESGRILRNAWRTAIANAAHELYRENVAKEDVA